MSYVYITSEPGLLTVGFYDPKGKWHADSDYDNREEAAARVAYLNGGRAAENAAESAAERDIRRKFATLIPTLGNVR